MNDEPIELLAPGSSVVLFDSEALRGTIIAIAIYPKNRIQYQVAWWDGRSRLSEWLEECEVKKADTAAPIKIGFSGPVRARPSA
jgi:hypothetical protein